MVKIKEFLNFKVTALKILFFCGTYCLRRSFFPEKPQHKCPGFPEAYFAQGRNILSFGLYHSRVIRESFASHMRVICELYAT